MLPPKLLTRFVPNSAKLDEAKVREIRALSRSGVRTVEIAGRFGVTHGAIRDVERRLSWAWVDHPSDNSAPIKAEES